LTNDISLYVECVCSLWHQLALLDTHNRLTPYKSTKPMNLTKKNRNAVGRPHVTTRFLKSCLLLLGTFYAGFYAGHHCALNQSSRALQSESLPFYHEGLPVLLNNAKDHDHDESVAMAEDNSNTNSSNNNSKSKSNSKLYSESEVQAMVQQRLDLFAKLHEKGEKRGAFLLERQQARSLHLVEPVQPSGQPPIHVSRGDTILARPTPKS
jgi:hypothetical protein